MWINYKKIDHIGYCQLLSQYDEMQGRLKHARGIALGEVHPENSGGGMCGSHILFMTKLRDIPHGTLAFYDLTRNSEPYLCPDP